MSAAATEADVTMTATPANNVTSLFMSALPAGTRQFTQCHNEPINIIHLRIQKTGRSSGSVDTEPLKQWQRGEVTVANGDSPGVQVPQNLLRGVCRADK